MLHRCEEYIVPAFKINIIMVLTAAQSITMLCRHTSNMIYHKLNIYFPFGTDSNLARLVFMYGMGWIKIANTVL